MTGGGLVAKGTSGDYWSDPNLPSTLKHALLKDYIPQFGGMTGSRAGGIVYLDGYAGEGRYESGKAGSAEIALRVARGQLGHGVAWTCFFAERHRESFERLRQVAQEYADDGVDARVRHGHVDEVLDEVVETAAGLPLFLFLDPTGLVLPFERLTEVLAVRRREVWPPTELLVNFSMEAVRRLGGAARAQKAPEASLARFDEVCGGGWWRQYHAEGGSLSQEEAAARVAASYAQRLGVATGMTVQSVPVQRQPHHKPLYNLVFATRKTHGLWVFGNSVAKARDAWWKTIELSDEESGKLFSLTEVGGRPDPQEVYAKAVPAIAANMERLLARRRGRAFQMVDHPLDVLGDFYGQVTDTVVRDAVRLLHDQGKISTPGTGEKRVRNLIVRASAQMPAS